MIRSCVSTSSEGSHSQFPLPRIDVSDDVQHASSRHAGLCYAAAERPAVSEVEGEVTQMTKMTVRKPGAIRLTARCAYYCPCCG